MSELRTNRIIQRWTCIWMLWWYHSGKTSNNRPTGRSFHLQVKQAVLTLAITPTRSDSKILVCVNYFVVLEQEVQAQGYVKNQKR